MTSFHHRLWTASGIAAMVLMGLGAAPASSVPASTTGVTLAVDGRVNATPWIAAADPFVAVAWGATASGKTDVFVAVSRDRGRTFAAPVQVNAVAGEARLGGELPPRVALVARAGAAEPEMAVLWTARTQVGETRTTTIRTARSRDGGRTFDPPIMLQSPGAAGDRGWPALALDERGMAHAVWLDHRGLAAARPDRPGGHASHQGHATHDGVAMAHRSSLYYAAIAGEAPAIEREVTTGVCYCCKTALAASVGGKVYAAWRHVYRGNLRDIALSTSGDGGRTFSAARRVSQDKWEIHGCPDDGPAMAVDASGKVHLVWPTVIGTAAAPQGALFYTTTTDGRTFTPRVRIETLGSPKPAHPQIAIDRAGRIAVAWDEMIDDARVAVVRQLRTAGTGGAAAATFGEPIRLAVTATASGEATTAMYPVLASTADGFLAAWTSRTGESSVIGVRPISLSR